MLLTWAIASGLVLKELILAWISCDTVDICYINIDRRLFWFVLIPFQHISKHSKYFQIHNERRKIFHFVTDFFLTTAATKKEKKRKLGSSQ